MPHCTFDPLRLSWLAAAVLAVTLCPILASPLAASPVLTAEPDGIGAVPPTDPLLGARLPGSIGRVPSSTDAMRDGPVGDPAIEAGPGRLSADDAAGPRRTEPSPDSLRSVLHSIITTATTTRALHQPTPRSARAQIGAGPVMNDDYFDPFELILDSDVAGSALRAVLNVKSTDGQFTVFSVFGMGDFVLELETTTHSAIVYELSSGWSASLSNAHAGGQLLGYSAELTRASEYGQGGARRPNVNFVKLVWDWITDFLTTPMGMVSAMVLVIVLTTWMFRRAIGVLQRRALSSRR